MRSALFVFAFLFMSTFNYAQLQIGYVDSDTIMKQLPDYQDTQQKLDALIQEWNEEVSKMDREWKSKYDDYEKRKLILSDIKRAEIEKELVTLEDNLAKYRKAKFGPSGELYKKQEELMKPIQNMVFNAIQEVAKEEDLDFVFDRSGDILFLYAKEEYDITNLVLEKLK